MTVVSPTQGNRSQAENALQRAAKIYSVPNSKLILEENDQVAAAIVTQATDHDLLVLGMREESWLQPFFFGTVAQRVAGQAQCPTLLVKAYAAEKSKLRRLLRVEANV
jgi:nucleotide-binding universal stress UspA family protein